MGGRQRHLLHLRISLLHAILRTDENGMAKDKSIHIFHMKTLADSGHGLIHPENLCAVFQKDSPRLQRKVYHLLHIDLRIQLLFQVNLIRQPHSPFIDRFPVMLRIIVRHDMGIDKPTFS